MTEILAFGDRRDNAQLMLDCAQLGYLPEPVLDMTFGRGRFWLKHKPTMITTNDLHTEADCGYDFTNLPPEWEGAWPSVVFDPPYKLNGTGGGVPSDEDYGVADQLSVHERHRLMGDGLIEAARVCKPRGFVLMKCQNQVANGRKHWQTLMFRDVAADYGLILIDMLHVQSYRAQPAGRRQLHSRGDYSTLQVFQKRKP